MMISNFIKNIQVIFHKELLTYLNTPIGYIFSSFYLLLSSFLFFFGLGDNSFWDLKVASMEQYFVWTPILFIIFIPAITMRLWSEEEKSGTIEVLFTLPIKDYEICIGKFLSSLAFIGLILIATLLTPLTIWILGDIDFGMVFSGYLGTLLLAGSYISIGILVSSLTKDQISAYIISMLLCLVLFLMGYQPVLQFFGKELGSILAFLSVSHHFEAFRIGIFDLREVFFFLSFSSLLIVLNVFVLRGKR